MYVCKVYMYTIIYLHILHIYIYHITCFINMHKMEKNNIFFLKIIHFSMSFTSINQEKKHENSSSVQIPVFLFVASFDVRIENVSIFLTGTQHINQKKQQYIDTARFLNNQYTYRWFHENGSLSVHTFNEHCPSIPFGQVFRKHTVSNCRVLYLKIVVIRKVFPFLLFSFSYSFLRRCLDESLVVV